MKKYIIPVAAFLLIGTVTNAQTEKKPAKMATTKPMTAKPATKMANKPAMAADSTKHTAAAAMKRKNHLKPGTATAPKKTGTK